MVDLVGKEVATKKGADDALPAEIRIPEWAKVYPFNIVVRLSGRRLTSGHIESIDDILSIYLLLTLLQFTVC